MIVVLKILAAMALWSLVVGIIWGIDPMLIQDMVVHNSYLPLGVALLLAIGYTLSILFQSSIKAWLMAALMVGAMYLSINGILFWFVSLGLFVVAIVILTFSRQS